jgi:hypothetical protein
MKYSHPVNPAAKLNFYSLKKITYLAASGRVSVPNLAINGGGSSPLIRCEYSNSFSRRIKDAASTRATASHLRQYNEPTPCCDSH